MPKFNFNYCKPIFKFLILCLWIKLSLLNYNIQINLTIIIIYRKKKWRWKGTYIGPGQCRLCICVHHVICGASKPWFWLTQALCGCVVLLDVNSRTQKLILWHLSCTTVILTGSNALNSTVQRDRLPNFIRSWRTATLQIDLLRWIIVLSFSCAESERIKSCATWTDGVPEANGYHQ
jgi:hypothetical protein